MHPCVHLFASFVQECSTVCPRVYLLFCWLQIRWPDSETSDLGDLRSSDPNRDLLCYKGQRISSLCTNGYIVSHVLMDGTTRTPGVAHGIHMYPLLHYLHPWCPLLHPLVLGPHPVVPIPEYTTDIMYRVTIWIAKTITFCKSYSWCRTYNGIGWCVLLLH